METSSPTDSEPHLAEASKRLGLRIFSICENRLELLAIETREERERLLRAMWLAMAAAVFSLLAGLTLTLIVMVVFWTSHPIVALIVTGGIYAVAAAILFVRLAQLHRDWKSFADTLEQLKKDRECLLKNHC
ncbi:MAG: phage holin family protein [Limisphaerales bacterium]